MPALPNVPQVIKAQFVHQVGANINAFVHHYLRYTGAAPASADCNSIATALNAAWGTNLQALAHPNVSLVAVNVTDLTSPTSGQGSNTTIRVGVRTGGPLTANDCTLWNLRIGRRYRGGKARMYWPFGTDSDVLNPQQWTTTYTNAANSALNAYAVAANAITWTGGNISGGVNVSYYQGFTVVTNPITHRARNVPTLRTTPLVDPFTGSSVNQRIATQRRRQHFSA